MYNKHPSQNLNDLFRKKTYQGADPATAKYLFVGLDANFDKAIENSEIFPSVVKYLENGVSFWKEKKIHHPFRLPEYKKDGDRYHRNFEKIGFKKEHAEEVSFIEIIEVPTYGVSKLVKNDLNYTHLEYLNGLMNSNYKKYVFLPSMAANLLRSTKMFPWLRNNPIGTYRGLEVWGRVGDCVIFKTYHFSYPYDPIGMGKQLATIGTFLNYDVNQLGLKDSIQKHPPYTSKQRKLKMEESMPTNKTVNSDNGKNCSICGNWFHISEFHYGNKENNSYCQKCNKEERAAYRKGGTDATREYRERKRAEWKK